MRKALVVALATLSVAVAACGKTEKSGEVGQTLEAEGIQVRVERVDQKVPVPADDITGLSSPSPGFKLVGVYASACSDHGGSFGAYAFGLESSEGGGRLKFPQMNYAKEFESVRAMCGRGWIVFEIPAGASPEKVTFGFEDTGSARQNQNNVDARFSWSVG